MAGARPAREQPGAPRVARRAAGSGCVPAWSALSLCSSSRKPSSEGDLARVTDRPCCVNLVLDFAPDERLEVVVEERVP